MTAPSENPADLDRQNPEAEIAARAEAYRNWGRWGEDDRIGTLNFIDAAKRVEAAGLVRDGVVVSLAQPFDTDGPQTGWRRRTNPVHTMTDTGTDAERGNQGFRTASAGPTTSSRCRCSARRSGTGSATSSTTGWRGTAVARAMSSRATATS